MSKRRLSSLGVHQLQLRPERRWHGAYDIAITTIDSSTYALVAAAEDDPVIDSTDINNPIAASASYRSGRVALDLHAILAITTIDSTYALVAAKADMAFRS